MKKNEIAFFLCVCVFLNILKSFHVFNFFFFMFPFAEEAGSRVIGGVFHVFPGDCGILVVSR